jgi:hypothetical protein
MIVLLPLVFTATCDVAFVSISRYQPVHAILKPLTPLKIRGKFSLLLFRGVLFPYWARRRAIGARKLSRKNETTLPVTINGPHCYTRGYGLKGLKPLYEKWVEIMARQGKRAGPGRPAGK